MCYCLFYQDDEYIKIDKGYGDIKDEFVWAETWYVNMYNNYYFVHACIQL